MNKRTLYFLISGGIAALSVLILLCIFIVPNKASSKALGCYADDIYISVDETISDFYRVNNNNAEISFEVDDENIILINQNKIVGLKAGKTNVTITATFNDEVASDSFVVYVEKDNYTVELVALSNCDVSTSAITMTSSTCQFYFKLYDKLGLEIEIFDYEISSPKASVFKSASSIILQSTSSTTIKITIASLNFETMFDVVVST